MSRTQINATLVNLTSTPVTQMTLDTGGIAGTALQIKEQGKIVLYDSTNANTISLNAPTTLVGTYSLALPTAQGGSNTFLKNDGAGNLSWASAGGTVTVNTGSSTQLAYYSSGTTIDGLPITWNSSLSQLRISTGGGNTKAEIYLQGVATGPCSYTLETNGEIIKLEGRNDGTFHIL